MMHDFWSFYNKQISKHWEFAESNHWMILTTTKTIEMTLKRWNPRNRRCIKKRSKCKTKWALKAEGHIWSCMQVSFRLFVCRTTNNKHLFSNLDRRRRLKSFRRAWRRGLLRKLSHIRKNKLCGEDENQPGSAHFSSVTLKLNNLAVESGVWFWREFP